MNRIDEMFEYLPACREVDLGRYVLKSNPDISILDAGNAGGGYCPGQNNGDGTYTAHIARETLVEAMQKCLEIATEQFPVAPPPADLGVITIIKRVLFFSPAGTEPKVSVEMKVPGKPKITKRSSRCIHFDIGERSFIADKASWLSRKENGFIYALESGARGL